MVDAMIFGLPLGECRSVAKPHDESRADAAAEMPGLPPDDPGAALLVVGIPGHVTVEGDAKFRLPGVVCASPAGRTAAF